MTTKANKKMIQEVKEEWLKALRSDNYPQTKGVLRDEEGYCCLGVLCDVYREKKGVDWNENKDLDDLNSFKFLEESVALPNEVMDWAGLEKYNPNVEAKLYNDTYCETLAELNDNARLSFKQIADIIEQQL